MTIIRTLTVSCDAPECADDDGFVATTTTIGAARSEAWHLGWRCRPGGDFCPKHLDEPVSQS
jgi:hypothetical protein